jgi:hypothetical protein
MQSRVIRFIIAALLLSGAALFAVGSVVEHGRESDRHAAGTTESEGEHTESESEHAEGAGSNATETGADEVRPLGLNLESTSFVIMGVLISVVLAAAVVWRPTRPVLLLVVAFAATFALLDLLEVIGQAGNDTTLVAIASMVGLAHAAAAVLDIGLLRTSAT